MRATDSAIQTRAASELRRSILSYIRDYSAPLVRAARRGDPRAASLAATARGKRLIDAIRARFDDFVARERRILANRQADADADADRAELFAGAGLVGSLLLIAAFSLYLTRAIVLPVRRAAGMAGRLAGGDLSVRMPETGVAEIGALERSFNAMGASLEGSRAELQRFADEQASLRRVATLVARGVPPGEVLERVVHEVSERVESDGTALLRYEPDGTATMLARWDPAVVDIPMGRLTLPDESVAAKVRATGRPVSSDWTGQSPPELTATYRDSGIRSLVGAPIFVAGALWGVMITAWRGERPREAEVEARMSQFTELVATAIANAESRAELIASRARVVAAADESRRRIERDLHDGTQQRLISVGLELRAAEGLVPPEQAEVRAQLLSAISSLGGAVDELQEISRGIHPAILSRGGLTPALKTLARRARVPVELSVDADDRLPQHVEVATYYVVSEALTNAAKHAQASTVHVYVAARNGALELRIKDDGVGGADPARGSGLVGLKDRVEALGGRLEIASPASGGTELRATIPLPPAE